VMLIALVGGLALNLVPEADLWIERGLAQGSDGFPLLFNPVLKSVNQAMRLLGQLATLLTIGGWAFTCLRAVRVRGLGCRQYAFLASTLITGPMLLINLFLKNEWGRARPHHLAEFGGHALFTPALIPSNQCDVNCSFASGDASLAFWLVAIALVLPH